MIEPLFKNYLERTEFSSYEDFFQNYKLIIPDHFNFSFDIVDTYAELDPDRLAMIWCDDNGHELRLTFAELAKRVNRCANFLRRIGVQKGDRVILTLKSRYEFWDCILALHKLGAVVIPATHMLRTEDIAYRIQAAGIKVAICVDSDTLQEDTEAANRECENVVQTLVAVNSRRDGWLTYDDEVARESDTFIPPPRDQRPDNSDPMIIYFTSGTSGYPKMVQHNFTYPLGHILTAVYWQNVQPGKLHFTVADTGWGKAVWGKLYGQWLGGCVVFVHDQDRFSAGQLMQKIHDYRISTFCAPPTVYRFLIKEDLSKYDLSSLQYCVTAGEPLNAAVYNRFLEQTGLKLREAFGQTETVCAIATWPWLEPKPGFIGKPAPGYNFQLLSPEGEEVELGDEGELCINTNIATPSGFFGGYYQHPEMTEKAFSNGFFHTGDTAWKNEDGYLKFVGRADDVIKSSGYRIGPFEVESVLMKHPAVLECAITGVPDPTRGLAVKATIVLVKGQQPSEQLVHDIQQFVKENTAPYKYPRVIEFVDALPKTISGKIQRTEIRRRDMEKYSQDV